MDKEADVVSDPFEMDSSLGDDRVAGPPVHRSRPANVAAGSRHGDVKEISSSSKTLTVSTASAEHTAATLSPSSSSSEENATCLAIRGTSPSLGEPRPIEVVTKEVNATSTL